MLCTNWKILLQETFRISYQRDFSEEYNDFIQESDGCKIIMTLARVQPFCRNKNLDIGVYKLNKGRIFPETVKERNTCLYLHKTHFSVIWKLSRKTSLLHSTDEIGNNFKFEETQINITI